MKPIIKQLVSHNNVLLGLDQTGNMWRLEGNRWCLCCIDMATSDISLWQHWNSRNKDQQND
jgi:hypothetical protein